MYLCTDGASVNLGSKNGLAAKLREDSITWLKAIHCFNHRLELAVKDSLTKTFLNEIIEMLQNLYQVYQKSPKRLRDLRELAFILDEEVHKPDKCNGTRWLQHKARACKTLIDSYPVIILHLEQLGNEHGLTNTDKSRFKGYHRKMTSLKFVIYLLFFSKLLKPLSELSVSLQGGIPDLVFAKAKVEEICNNALLNDPLFDEAKVISETKEYRGVKLVEPGQPGSIVSHYLQDSPIIINSVNECIKTRFTELDDSFINAICRILHTQIWPSDSGELSEFGKKDVDILVETFEELLKLHNVETNNIQEEFSLFKTFFSKHLSHLKYSEVWAKLLSMYREQFGNLSHLIEVLVIFPVSNAVVERGFSVMNRVKTDWRSSLGEKTVDNLMRIKISGPESHLFEPNEAVELFLSVNRRPYVQCKRKLSDMIDI